MKARSGLVGLVLLVHIGLLWMYWRPQPKTLLGDEGMYRRWASEILAGRDPEIDLLWPPLYPRFVALVLGHDDASLLRVQLVQTGLLLIAALALRDITLRLTGRPLAADLAAWLLLAYPPIVAFAHYLWPEVLHLALFLPALWVLLARSRSLGWMPVAGVLLGLALLTKSLLGPFVPVLLLLVLVEEGWPRRLARAALVLGALAATVGPTMIGNRPRAERLVIADSSLFNLWVGLNDRSRRSLVDEIVADEHRAFQASAGSFAERNAILRARIAGMVHDRGVLPMLHAQIGRQYFRLFDKDSYLTDQLPDGPVGSTGGGYHGTPRLAIAVVRGLSYALYGLILVGAAAGLAACPFRSRLDHWVVLAFVAYNLVIFLLLHVKSRYLVQFLPFLILYAACAVDAAWARWRAPAQGAGMRGSPSALAWTLSGLGAVLLLLLAFGGKWL